MGFLVAVKHGTGATLPQGHPLRAALGFNVEREIWGWHISLSLLPCTLQCLLCGKGNDSLETRYMSIELEQTSPC